MGFLYATDALAEDLQQILIRLKSHAPQLTWISSIGMGLCSTAREYYEEPALALMIGIFPDYSFRILSQLKDDAADPDYDWWKSQEVCFALLHGDPGAANIGDQRIAAVGLREGNDRSWPTAADLRPLSHSSRMTALG